MTVYFFKNGSFLFKLIKRTMITTIESMITEIKNKSKLELTKEVVYGWANEYRRGSAQATGEFEDSDALGEGGKSQ